MSVGDSRNRRILLAVVEKLVNNILSQNMQAKQIWLNELQS